MDKEAETILATAKKEMDQFVIDCVDNLLRAQGLPTYTILIASLELANMRLLSERTNPTR